MTAIWARGEQESEWELLSPRGFPEEAALHDLVEETPQLLPLAGNPQLVVVGREVRLGSGAVDLLAVEPSGRPAVIEVKLAKNAEARRAIVAQVLAYAAFLKGLSVAELEDLVRGYLQKREHDTIAVWIYPRGVVAGFSSSPMRDPPHGALQDPAVPCRNTRSKRREVHGMGSGGGCIVSVDRADVWHFAAAAEGRGDPRDAIHPEVPVPGRDASAPRRLGLAGRSDGCVDAN